MCIDKLYDKIIRNSKEAEKQYLSMATNMISSKKCNKSPLTDEAFKEQLERVLRNNVLDTDIRITGDTVIGAKLKEYFEQKEQKPAEWSEKDEEMRNLIIAIFEVNHPDGFFKANELGTTDMRGVHTEEIISWLKSLRPKSQWKPSEEQMDILDKVYHYLWADKNATADMQDGLGDFIDELKKLK